MGPPIWGGFGVCAPPGEAPGLVWEGVSPLVPPILGLSGLRLLPLARFPFKSRGFGSKQSGGRGTGPPLQIHPQISFIGGGGRNFPSLTPQFWGGIWGFPLSLCAGPASPLGSNRGILAAPGAVNQPLIHSHGFFPQIPPPAGNFSPFPAAFPLPQPGWEEEAAILAENPNFGAFSTQFHAGKSTKFPSPVAFWGSFPKFPHLGMQVAGWGGRGGVVSLLHFGAKFDFFPHFWSFLIENFHLFLLSVSKMWDFSPFLSIFLPFFAGCESSHWNIWG